MLRYLTAGESHGEALIGIVEGMPAGVPLTAEIINHQLARRWLGFGRGGRAKFEQDLIHIYSGVRFSKTIASPISMRLDNAAFKKDKSGWPDVMAVDGDGEGVAPITLPRPGHADLEGVRKYGFNDIRPVIDRASARETAIRVACCTLGRQLLKQFGIEVGSHVLRIGEVGWKSEVEYIQQRDEILLKGAESISRQADQSQVRMMDTQLSQASVEHITDVKRSGDSLGGIYEVIVTGAPPGLGSYVHWDRRLSGQLAQAILSIQAQKGVEIGSGIANASRPGSTVHDEIYLDAAKQYQRRTNHAGGLEGGMTNGMPVIVRGYMKPIPTLIKPLETVDLESGKPQPTRYERSDVTSVPAASTVAEATVAWVIANALLDKYGADSLDEMLEHYPHRP